jgi:hypothetical protein
MTIQCVLVWYGFIGHWFLVSINDHNSLPVLTAVHLQLGCSCRDPRYSVVSDLFLGYRLSCHRLSLAFQCCGLSCQLSIIADSCQHCHRLCHQRSITADSLITCRLSVPPCYGPMRCWAQQYFHCWGCIDCRRYVLLWHCLVMDASVILVIPRFWGLWILAILSWYFLKYCFETKLQLSGCFWMNSNYMC